MVTTPAVPLERTSAPPAVCALETVAMLWLLEVQVMFLSSISSGPSWRLSVSPVFRNRTSCAVTSSPL